jgi:predicted MFS family arabinose efflux permease
VFNNFISERLHVGPGQLGILESLREMPGLMTAFLASALVGLAEPRLGAVSLALMSLGFAALGRAEVFPTLVFWSVLWSLGFHLWASVQPALALALSEHGRVGARLGQLSSVAAVAGLLALLLVRELAPVLGYRGTFVLAGLCILCGSILCCLLPAHLGTPDRVRFLVRRRYSLYYWLIFLEGCRRQVFGTFAIFVLVRQYHTSVTTTATLLFVNGLVTLVTAPKVGALIDRLGERKTLKFYYVSCFFLFLGYGVVHDLPTLYLFFCLDSFLFTFSLGITTYLQRILEPADRTPTLAMGVTCNHVAAVVVPLVGGQMWRMWGYETTFLAGSVVALISLASCWRLRTDA